MGAMPGGAAYGAATRWVLTAVVVILVMAAMWFIRGILLLTLASIILVILFTMPARFLARRGVNRQLATLISLVLIVGVVALIFAIVLPTLVSQFAVLLGETVPTGLRELVDRWDEGALQQQFPFLAQVNLQDTINAVGTQIASAVGQIGASVLPVLGGVANTVLSILIVVFLSLYFLSDPKLHQEGLVQLFPLWYRDRARDIIAVIDTTLRGWLRATLASMAFAGIATGVLLALLGIEQAAALGVLTGVLSFVPNFGPIVALVPSVAAGIVETPDNLLWIVVIIYGVSFVQSQVLTPILVADSIKLPAVLILLGQIVAGIFFGFLGLMLAVPITAIVTVLVSEIYIKDVLGDRPKMEDVTTFRDELLADEA